MEAFRDSALFKILFLVIEAAAKAAPGPGCKPELQPDYPVLKTTLNPANCAISLTKSADAEHCLLSQ
jgi:hypothetical protein